MGGCFFAGQEHARIHIYWTIVARNESPYHRISGAKKGPHI